MQLINIFIADCSDEIIPLIVKYVEKKKKMGLN